MDEVTRTVVNTLLGKARALQCSDTMYVRDYTSMKKNIMLLELEQEVDLLQSMLSDACSFKERFKARCIQRETNTEKGIPFHLIPESLSNMLYWEVAKVIFQPKTMHDLLKIILPGIKWYLKIDFPKPSEALTSEEIKKYWNSMLPVLIKSTYLDGLNKPPSIDALHYYVIAGNILFDAKEIEHFSFAMHVELHMLLSRDYPELAKKLYNNNYKLQELSDDLQTYNQQGMPPKSAIEKLIRGLMQGGTLMTGEYYANKVAQEAVKQFFQYLSYLPCEIKESIMKLAANGRTLRQIIEQEIEKGGCVETTADHLIAILQQNNTLDIITLAPRMNQDSLRAIEKKYGGHKNRLKTKKNSPLAIAYPSNLIQKVMKRIHINTIEVLVDFIINFPPILYDELWQNISLVTKSAQFTFVAKMIQSGFFSQEQITHLAPAIVKNYHRFDLEEPLIFWTIQTNSPLFVTEALQLYPKSQWLDVITQQNSYGTLLHLATSYPESFKIVLQIYPKDNIVEAIRRLDVFKLSVLNKACSNAESLQIIIDRLTPEQFMDALKPGENINDTALLHAAYYPNCLKMLLEVYPRDQLMQANNFGISLLHRAASNPASLKIVLQYLPSELVSEALSLRDIDGFTPLHCATGYPDSLRQMLQILAKNKLLEILNLKNNKDQTVVDLAADNDESMKLIKNALKPSYPAKIWSSISKGTTNAIDQDNEAVINQKFS